ncbi:MAG: outer membrane protein transport protein [Acidaminococcaceae bacterium]|nr:outer membrane protein transport protein [Acidaminococcaceae bacterium]
MKKSLCSALLLGAMLSPSVSFAEGFALIEFTTEGVAMGGAAMFIENDAGNMAYNPVGITMCEGQQLKFNATYISPRAEYDAFDAGGNHIGSDRNRIHPAWAPGTYYVKKIDDKQWWGLGCFSRFGNMSEFEAGTIAATNNRFAKVQGLSITPTYARKAGNKLFWAVGADINYAKMELQKDYTVSPSPYTGTNKTEGKSWALGWNMGLRYAPTDKDNFGLAYRSKISHTLDTDFDWYNSPYGTIHTTAHTKVTLPDSYHFGYSHKFDKKHRVELSAIRTQWHNFKSLAISFDNGLPNSNSHHNWKDGWRYAIGYEYNFSNKYTGMLGFAFDDGAIPYDGGDFMIPMGCRRTYSIGCKYHDKKQTLALSFAYMTLGDLSFKGNGSSDAYASAHSHNNSTKIISIGYTLHF